MAAWLSAIQNVCSPNVMIYTIIGVGVGMLIGTPAYIASIISWDTANNASIGGALTTALCLGVPGDSNTAVLLGSLMMYGMTPGPTLFSEQAGFVRNLMVLMIVANILILVIGLLYLFNRSY